MKTNWRKLADKEYLGSWDLPEDNSDFIVTINNIEQKQVKNPQGKDDLCIVCNFRENIKPMILNATNCKTIEKVYGTPYLEEWAGKKIALFKTTISAFGDTTEAIRIRNFIPREIVKEKHYCAECGCEITAANGMDADSVAAYTNKKYGRELCSICASKLKNGGNQ